VCRYNRENEGNSSVIGVLKSKREKKWDLVATGTMPVFPVGWASSPSIMVVL
jgi:hypothetical protein